MLSHYSDWGMGAHLLSLFVCYIAPMAGATAAPFARRRLGRRAYWMALTLCAAPFLAGALYSSNMERLLEAAVAEGDAAQRVQRMIYASWTIKALQGVAIVALFALVARRLLDAGAPPWGAVLFTPVPLLIAQHQEGGVLVAVLAAAALAAIGAAAPRPMSVKEAAETFE